MHELNFLAEFFLDWKLCNWRRQLTLPTPESVSGQIPGTLTLKPELCRRMVTLSVWCNCKRAIDLTRSCYLQTLLSVATSTPGNSLRGRLRNFFRGYVCTLRIHQTLLQHTTIWLFQCPTRNSQVKQFHDEGTWNAPRWICLSKPQEFYASGINKQPD